MLNFRKVLLVTLLVNFGQKFRVQDNVNRTWMKNDYLFTAVFSPKRFDMFVLVISLLIKILHSF